MHYWRCFVWGHCVLLKNQSCLYPGHLLLSTRLTTNPLSTDAFFQILWEFAVCNEHWISAAATLPFYPVLISISMRISLSNLVFQFQFQLDSLSKGTIWVHQVQISSNLFSVLWLTETTMDKYSDVETKRWSEKVNMSERERRWAHLLLNWFFIMVFGCN